MGGIIMVKLEKRNLGLDIVRTVAIIFVVLVHSFGNTHFNDSNMVGLSMFFLLIIRHLSFICVPLFIILTGYCKSSKEVNSDHYSKIKKILRDYFIISIITLFLRYFVFNNEGSLYNLGIGLFNFSTVPYAWYLKMYIGLFLLIPFLNILYNNIKTKKEKIILISSLIFICSIPQSLALFNINYHSLEILPSWWGNLYPIMYYFIGCFIREYQVKIKSVINIFLIVVLLFVETFMIYFYCQGRSINNTICPDYNFIPVVLLATLVFIFLYQIKSNNKFIQRFFYLVSKYSFNMYLISYSFDILLYKVLNFNIHIFSMPILGIIFYTPLNLILSFITAFILDKIVNFKVLIKKKW